MSTNRRDFLKGSLGASALASMVSVPGLVNHAVRAAEQSTGRADTILVVLQLAGGNDGLNTIVPYADDNYAKNRRTLRLTAKEVLKIDSLLGFHPEMQGFERLFKDGYLTVVQGVGYPRPNDSHEISMRIWQTAHPEDPRCQTGWLGRVADGLSGQVDLPAAMVAPIRTPLTLNARRAIVPALRSLEEVRLRVPPGPGAEMALRRLLATAELPRDERNPLLEFMRQRTVAAHAVCRKIQESARLETKVEYPPYQLGAMLRAVGQLIRAEVGIRIYYTELGGDDLGGFDTHANQRDNHAALLRQLSASVAAFVEDLRRDKLLDRVVLMTFSEFGRTVLENGRRGTDHGSAAPMFLAGGKLCGGLVGPHPNLTELESGGLKHHTDFRRVYATLLNRWLGIESSPVLGGRFEPLDLVRA